MLSFGHSTRIRPHLESSTRLSHVNPIRALRQFHVGNSQSITSQGVTLWKVIFLAGNRPFHSAGIPSPFEFLESRTRVHKSSMKISQTMHTPPLLMWRTNWLRGLLSAGVAKTVRRGAAACPLDKKLTFGSSRNRRRLR